MKRPSREEIREVLEYIFRRVLEFATKTPEEWDAASLEPDTDIIVAVVESRWVEVLEAPIAQAFQQAYEVGVICGTIVPPAP